MASVFRHAGDNAKADRLLVDAHHLRTRFLKDFWMEAEGCYCLALEDEGRQVSSVTSNRLLKKSTEQPLAFDLFA